ncbi:MAG TPA: class I SAM-dependent methyltransferase [Streptosporangiaceae bacterium]|nr:class I SAM-dependent methyltransferase [Streptosporangiaceae bacterium]
MTSTDNGPLGHLAASALGRGLLRLSRQGSVWDRRTSAGLEKVTAAVLAAATVRPGDQVLEIGCGTGQLSLSLAEQGARVLAIDASQAMIARLDELAGQRALIGFECLAMPIERLSLPAESVDVIVSSYALHYLGDADKGRLVAAAYHWLKPGGMLVLADMMFGRGTTSHDRAIIRRKVGALAKKGVGGWWRIVKNSYRYLVRAQERPVSISTWATMLARAGFKGITASSIVNEAGIVTGRRPATGTLVARQVPRQPGAPE